MERLDFQLKGEVKTIWLNSDVRNTWEYRINKIANVFKEIELQTVKEGIRKATITNVNQNDLIEYTRKMSKHGLSVIPFRKTDNSNVYSFVTEPNNNASDFNYKVFVTQPNNVNDMLSALKDKDDIKIGELLGFPSCCIDFFEDIWVDKEYQDTIWHSAKNTSGIEESDREITIKNSNIYSNTILKVLGIRAVPHLPHSFDCEKTEELGKKFIKVGVDMGYKKEMKWLEYLLSLEAYWSALHGIAIIRTPLFKIRHVTDTTKYLYKVKYEGSNEIRLANKKMWQYNGFNSYLGMEKAHEPIVEMINYYDPDKVFDMGCGNGLLLNKLHAKNKKGIDYSEEAIEYGKGKFDVDFVHENIFDYILKDDYDIVHISAVRLFEVNKELRKRVLDNILNHTNKLVLSIYNDAIKKFGELKGVVQELNLENISDVDDNGYTQVVVIKGKK